MKWLQRKRGGDYSRNLGLPKETSRTFHPQGPYVNTTKVCVEGRGEKKGAPEREKKKKLPITERCGDTRRALRHPRNVEWKVSPLLLRNLVGRRQRPWRTLFDQTARGKKPILPFQKYGRKKIRFSRERMAKKGGSSGEKGYLLQPLLKLSRSSVNVGGCKGSCEKKGGIRVLNARGGGQIIAL